MRALLTLLLVPSLAAVVVAQPVRAVSGPEALTIGGDVPRPLTVGVADLRAMPRTTITVIQEGRRAVYEGVALAELLGRAGAPLGKALSGPALALAILATAADGYQVTFALADADAATTAGDLLVADTMDGLPLPVSAGPMRLVAPHDSRPARSVRMLERIDVVRVRR